jgi:hypothetical protein
MCKISNRVLFSPVKKERPYGNDGGPGNGNRWMVLLRLVSSLFQYTGALVECLICRGWISVEAFPKSEDFSIPHRPDPKSFISNGDIFGKPEKTIPVHIQNLDRVDL